MPDNPQVSLQAVCQVLKLTSRRVQQLISDGTIPGPTGPKNKPKYDLIACVWAFFDHRERTMLEKAAKKTSRTKADDEYRAAKAERERLRLDQEKALLMPKADVAVLCKFLLNVVKTDVLGQSRSLPSLLVGKTEAEISDILETENRKILEKAATGFGEIETNAKKRR